MLFVKNCRRIIENEIKRVIRHRKRNNLTYTIRSKLPTETQNFETVMPNSLGASIPYSLRAPRNVEENRQHFATILEIQSTLRQHVVLVSNSHRKTQKEVSQKIRVLKFFYDNRDGCIIQFSWKVKKYPQPEGTVLPSSAVHTHTRAVDRLQHHLYNKTFSFFKLNSATMEEKGSVKSKLA